MQAREVTQDQIEAMLNLGHGHGRDREICPHCEWLDSMDADERLVVHFPPGCWSNLVMISLIKRWLMKDRMPAALQLRFLETMKQMADAPHLETAATVVEPANEMLEKIYLEAQTLCRPGDHARPMFDMLERWEVRWHLIRLNSSLLEAIRVAEAAPRHGG
jgi:hypothetical protein